MTRLSHEERKALIERFYQRVAEGIPIVECDARRRASSRDVLMTLMRFLHSLAMSGALT